MLVPQYVFDTVYDIPLSLFSKRGITCLLLDIDNTLVPYDEPVPTPENRAWFELLNQHGIRVMFVSNNHADRVALYAEGLDVPYVADAGKPLVKKYRALIKKYGITPEQCAVVGDQIFTDVLAGEWLGAMTILVKPIKDVENAFFRFKRFWEKPFLRRYYKRQGLEK